jgi:hypothetical protein
MQVTKPADIRHYPRIEHSKVAATTVMSIILNAWAVADEGSLTIGEFNGRERNMAWFTVRQHDTYAIVYSRGTVELRQRNIQGGTIAAFTDQNTDTIWPVFSAL